VKTILVTGVGAIIGYGILRSLRQYDQPLRIVGIDIFADAVGQLWADQFHQAPFTSDPSYSDWIRDLTNRERVDLVIPGIEQDLHFFSENRELFSGSSTELALNSEALIELSKDKWRFYQELKASQIPVCIETRRLEDIDDLVSQFGFPIILKPRRGYASKGIRKLTGANDFDWLRSLVSDHFVAQPFIGSDDEEFTVGVFGNGSGNICGRIALKRILSRDGSTAKAKTFHCEALDRVLDALCLHFKPLGPTNFQFRRDGECWKLLEINPRISSSTSLRTAFGFNESAMCIGLYLYKSLPRQPLIRDGSACRFIEDRVVYDSVNI
jgi:carbamoyl-phosphate synthase large subunit